VNSAWRFSKKAAMPSRASTVRAISGDRLRLVLHLRLERLGTPNTQQPFRRAQSLGRAGGELRRERGSFLGEVFVRHDAGDEAPLHGFLRRQLPICQGQLRRPPYTYEAG